MSDKRTDYRLMFPSRFVCSADLCGEDRNVTIEKVVVESLQMTGGRAEEKPVCYFAGAKKALVLNKTNAKTIAKIHGTLTDEWAGKHITLYPTTTKFGRDTVDCVRVRDKAPTKPATKEATK